MKFTRRRKEDRNPCAAACLIGRSVGNGLVNVALNQRMPQIAQANTSAIIMRAKAGVAEAFDELVDLYSARLYGFLYRLTGHREEAEDLVQEVFVRLVRTLERYEDDGRFEAWLFRIATNLARDRIRRVKRSISTTPFSAGRGEDGESDGGFGLDRAESDDAAEPDAGMKLKEDMGRLADGLARLPEPEREVILLRHYTEMSFAQIAEMMGTPLGTALARSHRGLAKLREWMEGGG